MLVRFVNRVLLTALVPAAALVACGGDEFGSGDSPTPTPGAAGEAGSGPDDGPPKPMIEDGCEGVECQNAGRCVLGGLCRCAPGFDGERCEENVDDCADEPCQNEGRCVDGLDDYRCMCQPGFSGKDCETATNDPCD